jgi:exodeoxyribonuclease VII large subunit
MDSQTQQGLRLSEFAYMLQRGIQSLFGGQLFHVIGEVSNLKVYESRRHMYFHLIEKSTESGDVIAELSCFGFAPAFASLQRFETETGQKLGDGIEVLMGVRVEFHATRGLKLHLVYIDSNYTIGMLRKQRQRSIERLLHENTDAVWLDGDVLVTRNQKQRLPMAIRRIAVLSSEQSAGYQDFLHTLEENHQGYRFDLTLFPVLVQGEANAEALVKRLIEVYESSDPFDVVVLVRGGGSQTDLLLFDAYALVRAIARFPIPVFTGLGHLKDVSLADLVSHSALKTPTKVAEFIIDHNAYFEQQLIEFRQRMVLRVQRKLSFLLQLLESKQSTLVNEVELMLSKKNRMVDSCLRSSGMHALSRIGGERSKQAVTLARLQLLVPNALQKAKEHLLSADKLMLAYGPEALLKRGFAYIEQDGKAITRAGKIRQHKNVNIFMADGMAMATIQTIEIYGEKERNTI